jgi:hypothetical protein
MIVRVNCGFSFIGREKVDVKFGTWSSLFIYLFIFFFSFVAILFSPNLLFAEYCRNLFCEIEKNKATGRLIYKFSKVCVFVCRMFNDRT